jgi:DNA-binding transcriptional LysR family regulator
MPARDRLPFFVAVAEAGGFTAAAERLGTTKTQVSYQVARLEAELGGALFHRTTRSVTLTESGQRLLARCTPLLRELDDAVDLFGTETAKPTGTLRITAPPDYVAGTLGPVLVRFAQQYPDVTVDVVAASDIRDLVREGIDVAIRLGWPQDSTLKAIQLGRFKQYVVASKTYLESSGPVRHPENLLHHRWIALSILRSPLLWRFSGPARHHVSVRVRAFMRCDSPDGVLGLVHAGAGVSVATDFAAERGLREGTLVRILERWRLPDGGIFAVYPHAVRTPAKVRAFIDFMRGWRASNAED